MSSPDQIVLENGVLRAAFRIDKQGVVALDEISSGPQHQQRKRSKQFESSSVPVAQARFDYQGNRQDLGKTGKALIGSATGPAFQYKSHDIERKGNSQTLHITLHDDSSKITSISHWTLFDDLPVLRSSTTIQNDSSETRTLTEVDSLAIGGLAYGGSDWWNEYDLSIANNTWFREAQWKDMSLPDVGICDYGLFGIGEKVGSMSHFGLSNRSSFSTQGHLPMGMLKRKDQAETWLWQIENNGSWRWEVGDYKDSVYLAATGPEAADHEWSIQLEPGSHYDTCHTALVHIPGNQDAAFAALTQYRRQIIRPHEDYQHLPIIFNDYMNCLMGDPTEQKILDLVDHVAASGAEYFVIDAGWYAENSNWWDDVGAWEPSKWRFPRGFKWLLDEIAHKGLKPGVWVEPEVIGIRCKDVDLPMEAYFQRGGVRATERGRYQLDWRHPAVPKRMDGVIDRLVRGYGVKYFKFDYNIEIVHGTDVGGVSPGAGQEGHQRAYLAWIGRLLDRYPGLVIENCSSGAQRMDYGMLEVHTLQSTSDQQDPVLYAPISAALPTAVLPEQGCYMGIPTEGLVR